MNESRRLKGIVVLMALLGAVIIQSCSDNSGNKQSLATIPLNIAGDNTTTEDTIPSDPVTNVSGYAQLSVDIDNENHLFTISCEDIDKDQCWQGKILTYDVPDTANVYRIIRSDEKPSPACMYIDGWTNGLFQSGVLLTGYGVRNEQTNTVDYLSTADKKKVIDSITVLNASDSKNIAKIKTAYPNVTFNDVVLRVTYPAVSTNLYEFETIDTTIVDEYVYDTIKGRPFNMYVIRRVLDRINVGIPSIVCGDIDGYYDNGSKTKTRIISENYEQFYDNQDVYEVHCYFTNEKNVEVYLKNQPILSFEQAIEKASKELYVFFSDSIKTQQTPRVYAAELAYLTVQIYDMSDVEGKVEKWTYSNKYESYLTPFWIIYTHTDYKTGGADCGSQDIIIVNAINGEVLRVNS